MKPAQRRENLKQALLGAAERTIATQGLSGLRARALADNVGCAVGAIYNVVMVYTDFAATNTRRWRALFEHRLPDGYALPTWYVAEQMRLFSYVEGPLRVLQPQATPERVALTARSVVSAVHGMVTLGLEEKLYTLPLTSLREQVTFVVSAIGRGLVAGQNARRL